MVENAALRALRLMDLVPYISSPPEYLFGNSQKDFR